MGNSISIPTTPPVTLDVSLVSNNFLGLNMSSTFSFSSSQLSPPPEKKVELSILPKREQCALILEKLTDKEFVRDGIYDWLVNPDTGKPMHLDCYCEELKLALEVWEEQHYIFPNPFHADENEFKNQKELDELKSSLCQKNKVCLIVIPHKMADTPEMIETYIETKFLTLFLSN